ncbi:hypothetical protein CHU98_g5875 [Xylaria longipes]|nr:hypothetical protein CHU98_g5875 [Xylaria longipes]
MPGVESSIFAETQTTAKRLEETNNISPDLSLERRNTEPPEKQRPPAQQGEFTRALGDNDRGNGDDWNTLDVPSLPPPSSSDMSGDTTSIEDTSPTISLALSPTATWYLTGIVLATFYMLVLNGHFLASRLLVVDSISIWHTSPIRYALSGYEEQSLDETCFTAKSDLPTNSCG